MGGSSRRGVLIIRGMRSETCAGSGHSSGARRFNSIARLRAAGDPFKELSRLKWTRRADADCRVDAVSQCAAAP